ncbi:hypothetical protein BD413DRAFT_280648 [Trametes elegans]|nr:hypothetical protein BD413DRAFT_280648 [Trametes elegans]
MSSLRYTCLGEHILAVWLTGTNARQLPARRYRDQERVHVALFRCNDGAAVGVLFVLRAQDVPGMNARISSSFPALSPCHMLASVLPSHPAAQRGFCRFHRLCYTPTAVDGLFQPVRLCDICCPLRRHDSLAASARHGLGSWTTRCANTALPSHSLDDQLACKTTSAPLLHADRPEPGIPSREANRWEPPSMLVRVGHVAI